MAVRRTFRDFRVIIDFLKRVLPTDVPVRLGDARQPRCALQPVGFNDFLSLNIPARECCWIRFCPNEVWRCLYAPRGVGKTPAGAIDGSPAAASGVPTASLARPSEATCSRRRWRDAACLVARAPSSDFDGVGDGSRTTDFGFRRDQIRKADQVDRHCNEGQRALGAVAARR